MQFEFGKLNSNTSEDGLHQLDKNRGKKITKEEKRVKPFRGHTIKDLPISFTPCTAQLRS